MMVAWEIGVAFRLFSVCLDGLMCSDSLSRQCTIPRRLPVITISKNSEKDN